MSRNALTTAIVFATAILSTSAKPSWRRLTNSANPSLQSSHISSFLQDHYGVQPVAGQGWFNTWVQWVNKITQSAQNGHSTVTYNYDDHDMKRFTKERKENGLVPGQQGYGVPISAVNMFETYDPHGNRVRDIFIKCDGDNNGFLDEQEVRACHSVFAGI